ncbi:MAG: terminase large subunit domain-containing protein [Pirellulaceae bacterium]
MSRKRLACSRSTGRRDSQEKSKDGQPAARPGQASQLAPHVPSLKQREFLKLDCLEAFYGGAAGGGKSEALLMAALEYVHVPGYAALILRKDTQRLQLAGGLIPRSQEWLAGTDAAWNASRRQWTFPSGATLSFGYLAHPLDKYRYGSSEYQFIAFDELTEFAEEDYLFLFSRLRKVTDLQMPLRMRSASNPGGIGHVWVKERFVGQESGVRNQESGSGRAFIPARIADNPGLNQEEYRRSLAHLPSVLRERLMNGDWSVQEEGMFRQEWLRYYALVGNAATSEQLEIRLPDGRVMAAIPVSACRRFCTIDPAGTSADKARESRGRPASHSVIQVWDQPRGEAAKYLFLRHSWRGRVGFDGLVKVIREITRAWQPERLWIENEKLGQAAVDILESELPLETVATSGRDKITRAAPLILQFERGEILLPQLNTTWRLDFEAELLSWTGRDDQPSDQIDAAAYAAIIAQQNATGVIHIQPVVGR